jgi:Protein of unknown function (DUF4054)
MVNAHTYMLGVSDFELTFPELTHAPGEVIITAMADAMDVISEVHYQNLYRRAVLLLSAHLVASRWLSVAELQAAAAGTAVGQFQAVSRGTSNSGMQPIANWRGDDLHNTRYGLQLLQLKTTVAPRFIYA